MNSLRTVYRKSLRELWRNRGRTVMVALSVAIGVLGVGLIVTTYDVLVTDLYRRYASIHPAQVEIIVHGGATIDDLKGLSSLSGVADVQGRATTVAR
ncbi:MAG: hypothetical protein KDE23_26200, partial [Caldilinea sp.]|nr:hypothetical protein [Caldilinea sp.]